jgi:hypothetical protein
VSTKRSTGRSGRPGARYGDPRRRAALTRDEDRDLAQGIRRSCYQCGSALGWSTVGAATSSARLASQRDGALGYIEDGLSPSWDFYWCTACDAYGAFEPAGINFAP